MRIRRSLSCALESADRSHRLDAAMSVSVRCDCIGGFVVTQLYGMDRATVDVDVIELAPLGDDEARIRADMLNPHGTLL